MASTTVNPSPNDPAVSGARADGAANYTGTGAISIWNFNAVSMDVGTFPKGSTRSVIWIVFEIPFPAGTKFSAMSLGLERVLTGGSLNLPIWIGFIAADSTWNTGDESGLAWHEYTNIEDLPHPASATDAAWLGSSASLSHAIGISDHSDGDIVKWGTGVPGLHYESSKFLTDLQAAFDANEQHRTSRGVPVAMALVPQDTTSRLFRFSSAEAAIRPQLFLGVPGNGFKQATPSNLGIGAEWSFGFWINKHATESNSIEVWDIFSSHSVGLDGAARNEIALTYQDKTFTATVSDAVGTVFRQSTWDADDVDTFPIGEWRFVVLSFSPSTDLHLFINGNHAPNRNPIVGLPNVGIRELRTLAIASALDNSNAARADFQHLAIWDRVLDPGK